MAATETRSGFAIERISLTAPGLRTGARPLRFACLADLHMSAFTPRHERMAQAVNEAEPDFIFLPGDMIRRVPQGWDAVARMIGLMHSRHGTYAVRGNWEFKYPLRSSVLRAMLRDWGAELLINEARNVWTDCGTVHVGGVDDLGCGWPDFEGALQGARDADYGILLCHAPLGVRLLPPESGIGLTLSGHTHAGQIRIPLLWRLALPEYHGRFHAGLYETERGLVYVSRGIGAHGLPPVRFRCPPEVTIFEVTGAPQNPPEQKA